MAKGTVKKYLNRYWEAQNGERERISPENEKRVFEKLRDKGYDTRLNELLEQNADFPKKQRLTAQKAHRILVEEGWKVSYSTVKRKVREYKALHYPREVYIQQEHPAGRTAEYDWGEVTLTIGGMDGVYHFGVFVADSGLYYYARLYRRQAQPEVIDIHQRFLETIEGVPEEIVYDNMKTIVTNWRTKTIQPHFLDFSTHYGFHIRLCNVRKPNEKGTVENGIGLVRREAFSLRKDFESLEEANEYLLKVCEEINERIPATREQTRLQGLKEERKHLRPLPKVPWENYQTETRHINRYSMIQVDGHGYSVPDTYRPGVIEIRKWVDRIELMDGGQTIAVHPIPEEKGKNAIRIEHYLQTLQKKPGALQRSTALRACSDSLQQLYDHHYSTNPKGFLQILEILQVYGETRSMALLKDIQEKGIRPSADILRNLLEQNGTEENARAVSYPKGVTVRHPDLKAYDRLIGCRNE
jgi:transposase